MEKHLKRKEGITLVALVITIIILLLLAGIAIATLGGQNGLFAKVKQSKEKYSISEAKEKLELAISTLQIEQEGKGENLKKEDLPKINDDEIDVRGTSNFPVKVICNNYEFSIDSNFVVSYVGIANETIITYTTEPEGYTNKNEVKILVKIKNSKGIKTVEYPNDNDKLLAKGQTEVGFDYKVTANGTYTFKIVDNDNKEIIKDIVIDKIDTVEPKDFTPSAEDIKSTSFTVVANVEDGDTTDSSTKSGIERYEFFINGNKYESNEKSFKVTGLTKNTTYTIYAKAYDRAGNWKQSSTITTTTTTGSYPTLTLNGVIDTDDLAEDALGVKAYDGDENTFENCDTPGNNLGFTKKIKLDSSVQGKKLVIVGEFYVGGICFKDMNNQIIKTESEEHNCTDYRSSGDWSGVYFYTGILPTLINIKIPENAQEIVAVDGSSVYSYSIKIYEIRVE